MLAVRVAFTEAGGVCVALRDGAPLRLAVLVDVRVGVALAVAVGVALSDGQALFVGIRL